VVLRSASQFILVLDHLQQMMVHRHPHVKVATAD
jgi:hypothetical protein